MDKMLRLTSEDRENLVAYLDGELDEGTVQRIDKVLSKSEVARHEVESLARTWEMLDLLPRPGATSEFANKTLAVARIEETTTPLVSQQWFQMVRKGSIAAGWVAVIGLSAVIGFCITNRWVPNSNTELLEELPLVQNLDLYAEVQDLSVLRVIQNSPEFSEGEDVTSP